MIFVTFQLLFGGTKSWWFVFMTKLPSTIPVQLVSHQTFVGVFAPLHVMFWRALICFIYTILGLSLLQFCFSFTTITSMPSQQELWILSKCQAAAQEKQTYFALQRQINLLLQDKAPWWVCTPCARAHISRVYINDICSGEDASVTVVVWLFR